MSDAKDRLRGRLWRAWAIVEPRGNLAIGPNGIPMLFPTKGDAETCMFSRDREVAIRVEIRVVTPRR